TGSVKTLAFGIVLASAVGKCRPAHPQGLVLVPTRELASQVAGEIAKLIQGSAVRVAAVYGGAAYGPQVKLARNATVLVATPGRLEDLIERRAVSLEDVNLAVIDEADRMADMGFLPSVKKIMRMAKADRQTLLFSATLDGDIKSLVNEFQRDPVRHEVEIPDDGGDVEHRFHVVDRNDRMKALTVLANSYEKVIVFCRTKHGSDRVAKNLDSAGVSTCVIHGNRSQAQREKALQQFKKGQATVMVATDVAARGIHIDDVPLVVHYDLPEDVKDYIHRSGRTGRAGRDGVVVSLIDASAKKSTIRLLKGSDIDVEFSDFPFAPREEVVADAIGAIGTVPTRSLVDQMQMS
ncbi:MAG: DEAD/DEAH box helicase, partial [Actinomycetota bacterium]